LEKFPDKDWSCSALDRLLRQIDATVSADKKSGSSRERTVYTRDMQMSVQMATTLSTTVTAGIAYELLKRLFHIGNFCFWVPFFQQMLLKNCAVDFVEICNVCTRKVIIKAAKRIFNSDKIWRSYCDFYFGVTFLEHTVDVFIKNEEKVTGRVGCAKWTGAYFRQLLFESNEEKFSFRRFIYLLISKTWVTRSSSWDETANVNFLRRHRARTTKYKTIQRSGSLQKMVKSDLHFCSWTWK